MTTADLLIERASSLARSESDDDDAISQLLLAADGHRVPVVVAKRRLTADADAAGWKDDDATRAVSLLQSVMDRMPV